MADDDLRILEYLDASGQSPFARWFSRLNPTAAAKVTIALYRLEHGNFSNVKGVGAGVYEYRIDFGPGYRIYFGKDGDRIVILLRGSNKKGQAVAILNAQAAWALYKKRKTKPGTNRAMETRMALTRDFRETTYARAQRDGAFRKALLTEAVNAYLSGDETVGKTVLRDFINATIGFEKLGTLAGIPSKSLHRMLSSSGNPSTANFFAILRVLQEQAGVRLKVRAA